MLQAFKVWAFGLGRPAGICSLRTEIRGRWGRVGHTVARVRQTGVCSPSPRLSDVDTVLGPSNMQGILPGHEKRESVLYQVLWNSHELLLCGRNNMQRNIYVADNHLSTTSEQKISVLHTCMCHACMCMWII